MSIYLPTIPTGLVNLDTDFLNIQNNFIQLDTSFNVNHFKFSDQTTNNGKHSQINFPVVIANPTSAVGELIIYPKSGAAGVELWMVRDNIAGTATALTSSKIAAPTAAAAGQSWLPGGILLIWSSFDPNSTITPTFPFTGFPNNCWNVQLTIEVDNSSTIRNGISAGTLTKTGFTWEGTISGDTHKVYYLAIGN